MSEYTFQGYRRANGKVGARNLVAVIPSVICANDVGRQSAVRCREPSDISIIRAAASFPLT